MICISNRVRALTRLDRYETKVELKLELEIGTKREHG